jgi:PTH1 family peptidyl-tRNA hydrolase
MELPFGTVRVKLGGGHGGHNGLRDLHKHLGSPAYVRVRVGVSRPLSGWKPADYVLGRWSTDQASQLEDVVNRAADAVEMLVQSGVDVAAEHVNSCGSERVSRAS